MPIILSINTKRVLLTKEMEFEKNHKVVIPTERSDEGSKTMRKRDSSHKVRNDKGDGI